VHKFLHEFLKAVFLGVLLKLLLDTYNVWSGKTRTTQEYRLKRYVTLDPTVVETPIKIWSFKRLVSVASQ
jgi:hypothetical protein